METRFEKVERKVMLGLMITLGILLMIYLPLCLYPRGISVVLDAEMRVLFLLSEGISLMALKGNPSIVELLSFGAAIFISFLPGLSHLFAELFDRLFLLFLKRRWPGS